MVSTSRTVVEAEAATRFLDFVNKSPTPFHAVNEAGVRLEKAGFIKLSERDGWEEQLIGGGKYFYTRNQSSILAFTLPRHWKAGCGVSMVATHTDSCHLRVRPISNRSKEGYLQLGVETYGGGVWHSWFDRDLSLAGRVVVVDPETSKVSSRLVKIDRPLLRIPTLAIHLSGAGADHIFKFNQETEMVPILGLLNSQVNEMDVETEGRYSDAGPQSRHHPALLSIVADELSVPVGAIRDFELCLYDTQPACFGGLKNEFVFSPRMDNLFSTFAAFDALASYGLFAPSSGFEGNVNCIALFNHEETGSRSSSGAESSLLPSFLSRLSPTPALLAQSLGRSFLISSDVTHGIHPNYTAAHQDQHKPRLNEGVAIKTNASQSYTSDAIGSYVIRELVERLGNGAGVQEYEVRNDMPCGSTVGPQLSKMGVRTVDVGCPILSMHSIRETAGAHDFQHLVDLFASFFKNFADIDANLVVE